MSIVTLRHFTEADIPVRTGLLREARFQANLTDFAVVLTDEAMVDNQSSTINGQHDIKRLFTFCGPRDEIVGFAWISSIDWRSQSCELSFGVLPRYRGAYGSAAVAAAHTYLREQLNFRVIINQVLEHNTMLVSTADLASHRRVRCTWDSFTVGEWRTACYWSENDEDAQALKAQHEDRRRELAERIRALAKTSP